MTKNERINELEHTLSKVHVELSDLRLLIARLATRVGYLELADQKRDVGRPYTQPNIIPQWIMPTEITCKTKTTSNPAKAFPFTTKVDYSAIPQNSEAIMKFNSAVVSWPFPTSTHSSSSPA